MANDYYAAPTEKVPLTTIRSVTRNNDAAAVEAGFDILPSELDIKRSQYGSDASTSGALYEITVPDLDVAYYEGLEITFQALFENTAAANISVNGMTIVSIVDTSGTAIIAGSFKVDQAVTVVYVSSPAPNFQLISTAATSQDVQDAIDAANAAAASAAEAAASAAAAALASQWDTWDSGLTYAEAHKVIGSDNINYESRADGNLGNDPTTTTGFWRKIDFVKNTRTQNRVQYFYRNC